MSSSKRLLRRLVLSVAVVGVVSALAAASASAAVFGPSSGPTVQSGTITWKLNGGSPMVCSFNASGNSLGGLALFGGQNGVPCGGPGLAGSYMLYAFAPGTVRVANGAGGFTAPYNLPTYGSRVTFTGTATAPFVNGDATTPSRVVFNNTPVGYIGTSFNQVSWTGTVNVTTGSGGLVTLN